MVGLLKAFGDGMLANNHEEGNDGDFMHVFLSRFSNSPT